MDKVYLLLRNNQQTGPYSLGELLQQGLKPTDLIWVEGESCGWSFPSEIDVLKPAQQDSAAENKAPENSASFMSTPVPASASHTTTHSAPTTRHIYVSLPPKQVQQPIEQKASPEQSLEQKAEELFRRAQTYAAEHKKEKEEQVVEEEQTTRFLPRTLQELEQDRLARQQKQNRKRKGQIFQKRAIAILIIMLFIGAGYVLAKGWTNIKKVVVAALPSTYNLKDEGVQTAKRIFIDHQQKKEAIEYTTADTMLTAPSAEEKEVSKAPNRKSKDTTQQRVVIIAVPVMNDIAKEQEIIPPQVPDATSEQIAQTNEAYSLTTPVLMDNTADVKQKKAKRKKNTETPAATMDLSAKTDITITSFTNAATGEQGLHVTLHNHNSEIIKNATVELRYFDNQNGLVGKKVLTFSNISPGGSATVNASNNPAADHTNYRLLSAVN